METVAEARKALSRARAELAQAQTRYDQAHAVRDTAGWVREMDRIERLKHRVDDAEQQVEDIRTDRYARKPEAHVPEAQSLLIYDEARPCPKCGKGKALTIYRQDRLDRTCRRCRFQWAEAPLDSEAMDAKEPPAPPGGETGGLGSAGISEGD